MIWSHKQLLAPILMVRAQAYLEAYGKEVQLAEITGLTNHLPTVMIARTKAGTSNTCCIYAPKERLDFLRAISNYTSEVETLSHYPECANSLVRSSGPRDNVIREVVRASVEFDQGLAKPSNFPELASPISLGDLSGELFRPGLDAFVESQPLEALLMYSFRDAIVYWEPTEDLDSAMEIADEFVGCPIYIGLPQKVEVLSRWKPLGFDQVLEREILYRDEIRETRDD